MCVEDENLCPCLTFDSCSKKSPVKMSAPERKSDALLPSIETVMLLLLWTTIVDCSNALAVIKKVTPFLSSKVNMVSRFLKR